MGQFDPANCCLYSTHERSWHHFKQLAPGFALHSLGGLETPIKATRNLPDPSLTAPAARRRWWARCAAQDVPEIGSSIGILQDLIEESQVICSHTEVIDPSVGTLLAFGKAVSGKRFSSVDVVAFITGSVGADLAIGAMVEKPVLVDGSTVMVPRIAGGSTCLAYTSPTPIRQICFSGGVDNHIKPHLAVRTSRSTTVLQQERLTLPGNEVRFVAKPLLSFDSPGRVGVDSSDVAFNPWFNDQLGIIYQNSKWEVLELVSMSCRKPRTGAILGGQLSMDDIPGVALDGWGKIVWGGDLNSIMACNRRKAALFDIRSPSSHRPVIDLVSDLDRSWILDLKHGIFQDRGHDAFFLTSSHLTWLDIRQPGKPLMSCPHMRHRKDPSLSLELFPLGDSVNAVIYSRMNSLMTTHRFLPSTANEFPTVLGEPYIFPGLVPLNASSKPPISFLALPCRLQKKQPTEGEKPPEAAEYVTGYFLNKDLSVSQKIYTTSSSAAATTPQTISRKKRSANFGSNIKLIGTNIVDSDEDSEPEMVGQENESYTETGIAEPCLSTSFGYLRVKSNDRLLYQKRTNVEVVYEFSFNQGEEFQRAAGKDDPEHSSQAYTRNVEDVLRERTQTGELGISSLLEVRQPLYLFDQFDLENVTDGIKNLLNDESFKAYEIKSLLANERFQLLQAEPVEPEGAEGIPESQYLPIMSIYNCMLDIWVKKLPLEVPGKVRLRRERSSRMIAMDIWLASIGISLKPQPALNDNNRNDNIEKELPTPQSSNPQDEVKTAEPPTTTTTSPQQDSISRLRAYTHVEGTTALRPEMQRVLDSWPLGEDPWDQTYQSKDRPHKHHRQKQAPPPPPSSQLFSASQPSMIRVSASRSAAGGSGGSGSQGASKETLSQSQDGFMMATMSQVERGVYGSRKPAKKRRKTGF